MGSYSNLILIDNDLLAIGYGGDDQCARIGLLPTVLLIILVQGTKMQILQVSRLQRVLEMPLVWRLSCFSFWTST